MTQHGPVVAILHQYAYTGQGKTIDSSGQLEWYKNDDKSIKVSGGMLHILTKSNSHQHQGWSSLCYNLSIQC